MPGILILPLRKRYCRCYSGPSFSAVLLCAFSRVVSRISFNIVRVCVGVLLSLSPFWMVTHTAMAAGGSSLIDLPKLTPPQQHPLAPPEIFQPLIPHRERTMYEDYKRLVSNPFITSPIEVELFRQRYAWEIAQAQQTHGIRYWQNYSVSVQNALSHIQVAQYSVHIDIIRDSASTSSQPTPLQLVDNTWTVRDGHHHLAAAIVGDPDGMIPVILTNWNNGVTPRGPLRDLSIVSQFDPFGQPPNSSNVLGTLGQAANTGQLPYPALTLLPDGPEPAVVGGAQTYGYNPVEFIEGMAKQNTHGISGLPLPKTQPGPIASPPNKRCRIRFRIP